MTSYLLDTNAFSMALTDDPRLPKRAYDRMREADRLAVSAISFYEIGQKVRAGKWPLRWSPTSSAWNSVQAPMALI